RRGDASADLVERGVAGEPQHDPPWQALRPAHAEPGGHLAKVGDEAGDEALPVSRLERDLVIADDDARQGRTIARAFRPREPTWYTGGMDWRRLESGRVAPPPIATSEVRPSIRDFTQHLGSGRRALAVVPLVVRRDPRTGARLPEITDLA